MPSLGGWAHLCLNLALLTSHEMLDTSMGRSGIIKALCIPVFVSYLKGSLEVVTPNALA